MRLPEDLWARADETFGPGMAPRVDPGFIKHASADGLRNLTEACCKWADEASQFLVTLHAKAEEREAVIARMTVELADEKMRTAALAAQMKREWAAK